MKYFYLCTAASLILFFSGCTSRNTVLMDDYHGKKIPGGKLTIVKLFQSPIITNADDVVDDLGTGVPEEVYNNFFKDRLLSIFRNQRCFDTVYYIEHPANLKLEEKTLDITKKEKLKIKLPVENYVIENDQIKPDFILFVDNLQIFRNAGSTGMIGPNGMMTGGSFGSLNHQLNFAIWDNVKGKVVSYGRIADESTIVFGMTKGHWESVIKGLAGKILACSPFKYSFPEYSKFYSSEDDSL
jgi:hypothetical protein